MALKAFRCALAICLALMAPISSAALVRRSPNHGLRQATLSTLAPREVHSRDVTPKDSASHHHNIEQGPFSSYSGTIRDPPRGEPLSPPDGLAQFDSAGRRVQLESIHKTLKNGKAGRLAAKPPDVPSMMDGLWAGPVGRQPSAMHEGKPVAAFFGLEHEARLIKQYGLTHKDMAFVAKGGSPQERECRARKVQCQRKGVAQCELVLGAALGCAVHLTASH